MRRTLFLVLVAGVLVGGAGCGRYAVRPDEKEFLADRIMSITPDALDTDQHVLENREGSNGAYGAGGGGCGCN